MILLDTHVVAWLYQDPVNLLPRAVRQRLDGEPMALSPFVRLELQNLYEVKRLSVPADDIVDELVPRLELVVADPPADAVCRAAQALSWTRDPFDRLIAAHAIATETELATKDRVIREHVSLAWWETG